MDIEPKTGIVTLTHIRTGVELAKLRCEFSAFGTMTRLDKDGLYDSSNYWICVKPSDETVGGGLFNPKNSLQINSFTFDLKPR
jgi:hypothetical protein